MRNRIILSSDIHFCHTDWYGVKTPDRMQKWVDDLKREYETDPFEALLLLGDYSLDYWKWQTKGSYLEEGVSYTKLFVDQYLSQLRELPIEVRMIPGNHEQYGEVLWHRITGYSREDIYIAGDWLFILMDTYHGGLDPTVHHDGVYTGADMEFIRQQMAAYPEKRVILCCHYIEPWRDSEDFKALLRDDRVVCLFAGHTHRSEVWNMEPEYGSKKVIFTGQFGESCENPPTKSMWGFRELILTDTALESNYITPEYEIVYGGETVSHPYSRQDGVVIDLKKELP